MPVGSSGRFPIARGPGDARRRVLAVETALMDRPRSRRRSRVLHEHDGAAGLGLHLVFEVGVFHVDHVSGTKATVAEPAFTLEHIPELRVVVRVPRKPAPGR